ncbi:hypothetical protein K7432_001312 [Basidiobolus ranarum]|uniref:CAP-Gly domain-containing protein n=1 Tax=Basidiobolus ranarum TaxID=34480 RepID=A0ABR2W9S5_9FUNG
MFKAPKKPSNIPATSKRQSFGFPLTNNPSVREGNVLNNNVDSRRFSVPHPSDHFSHTTLSNQTKTSNDLLQFKSTHNRFSLPASKVISKPSPRPSSPPLSSSASDNSTSSSSSILSSKRSSTYKPPTTFSSPVHLQVGDKVQVDSIGMSGTLRFLGSTKFKLGVWAGVELDIEGTGKNDGVVDGVQYFTCAPKSGLFILAHKVSKISYSHSFSQCTPISESASEISEDYFVPSKTTKRASVPASLNKPGSNYTDNVSKRASSGYQSQLSNDSYGASPIHSISSSSSPIIPIETPSTPSRSNTPTRETQIEELGNKPFIPESTDTTQNRLSTLSTNGNTEDIQLKLEILETENEFLKLEVKQTKSNSEAGIMKTEIESLRRQKQEWEKEKTTKSRQFDLLESEMNELQAQFITGHISTTNSTLEHGSCLKNTEMEKFLISIRDIREVLKIKNTVEKELRDHIVRLEASINGELVHNDLIGSLQAELEERSVEVGKLTARLDCMRLDCDKEMAQLIESLAKDGKEDTSTYRDINFSPFSNGGKQDVNSLMKKLHQYEVTIKSQEKLLRDFKAAGAEAFDHYERTLLSIKHENASLKEQAENVVKVCRQLESDADILRFELEKTKEREEELTKESISLQEAVDNYQFSNTKRKEEIQKLKQELQKQSSEISGLTEMQRSGISTVDFNDEKTRLLSQIDELLSSINSLEAEKSDIVKTHKELLESHDKTKTEMANIRVLFEQFDMERHNWIDQRKDLQQQLTTFSEIIEAKDRELQSSKEELTKLNQFLEEKSLEISSLEIKIAELESQEYQNTRVSENSADDKDHAMEISQLKKTLQRLESDHSLILEENERLQNEHAELMEAQERLLEAHTHMEAECFKLMEEVEILHSESTESSILPPLAESKAKSPLDIQDHCDSHELGDFQSTLLEEESALAQMKRRYQTEIREMQKKVTDLELSKQHELDIQAKGVAELESLVEHKIFRETELEEQIIELEQKITQLETKLESARSDGSPGRSNDKVDIQDLNEDDIFGESNLELSRSAILYSPIDEELFCELCDHKGHDILSCTEYSLANHTYDERDSNEDMHCENCEEFGDHWTEDCPNQDETF